MNVARIKNGVVINIEAAEPEWVNANQGIDDCVFVEYSNDQPAHVGLSWNETSGFEQPPVIEFQPAPLPEVGVESGE